MSANNVIEDSKVESHGSLACWTLNKNEVLVDSAILTGVERLLIEDEPINYFNRLPDEVVMKIFREFTRKTLSNLALVCYRFSRLIQDVTFWEGLDLSHKIVKPLALGHIMNRQVKILKLTSSRILAPPFLPNSISAQPNFHWRLHTLDLTKAIVTEGTMVKIFRKCRMLLNLFASHIRITDKVLIALANNKHLNVLHFHKISGATAEGWAVLLQNCTKLKILNLHSAELNAYNLNSIIKNLPWNLDVFYFGGHGHLLKDRHVREIVRNCPHLRNLDISRSNITGHALEALTALDHLIKLNLSRCPNIPILSLLFLTSIKSLDSLIIPFHYHYELRFAEQDDEVQMVLGVLNGITIIFEKFDCMPVFML